MDFLNGPALAMRRRRNGYQDLITADPFSDPPAPSNPQTIAPLQSVLDARDVAAAGAAGRMPAGMTEIGYDAPLQGFFGANDAALGGAAGRQAAPPFAMRGGTQAEMVPDRAGRYENLLQQPGGREYSKEAFADRGWDQYKASMTDLANQQRFYTDDGYGGARLVTPPSYTQIMAGLARDELARPRRTETWQEILDPTTGQTRQQFSGRYYDRQGMPQADPSAGGNYEQSLLDAAGRRAELQRAMLPANPQFLLQTELEKQRQGSRFEELLLQQGMMNERADAENATRIDQEKLRREAMARDEEEKFMQRAAMEGAQGPDGKFSMDLYQRNLAQIRAKKDQQSGSFWNRPAASGPQSEIAQNQRAMLRSQIAEMSSKGVYNRAFGQSLADTIANVNDAEQRKELIAEALRNSRNLSEMSDALARTGAYSHLLANSESQIGNDVFGAGGMPLDIRSSYRDFAARPDIGVVTRRGRNLPLAPEDVPGFLRRGEHRDESERQMLARRQQTIAELLNALYDAGY